ncbi:DUF998 domain-containing protein [Mycobacterium sp. LTG2003]
MRGTRRAVLCHGIHRDRCRQSRLRLAALSGQFARDRSCSANFPPRRTGTGRLHDLFGLPVFAGIPIAGLASAATAVRSSDYRWACCSAGTSTAMAGSLVLFGTAIRGRSRLRGKSGIPQRISIAIGLGWLSSLSLRNLRRVTATNS